MTSTARLRRAGPADVDALLELRAVMFASFGDDPHGGSDEGWRAACRELLLERLDRPDLAAFVVEDDGGRVVAGGVGWVEQHLPAPANPSGRRGHIASMSTLPQARRHGHARAVVAALLEWFGSVGVTRVDLRATREGEPLYRSMGFGEGHARPLTWYADGPARR